MQIIQSIQNRIYEIRGERVMLDRDLAILYETAPGALNQAVKRNIKRFPADFLFQLTSEEWDKLQMEKANVQNIDDASRSQIVILNTGRGQNTKYLPYAFTEQGIAMLSSVLHSDKAISMNISIMRAFVDISKITSGQTDLKQQLQILKERLGSHDIQLNSIYEALENLLDKKAAQRKWDARERIGFRQ
jgi:ORF6N domain